MKRTNKLWLALLLTVLVAALLAAGLTAAAEEPTVLKSGSCGDNVTWVLTDDGVLTVSGTGATWDYDFAQQKHPWRFEPVTKVVVEPGVTGIGNALFGMLNITEISLPEGLTEIGNYAFYDCSPLEDLVFPASLTRIGEYAFYSTSVSTVSISKDITDIGTGAFVTETLLSIEVAAENPNYASDANGCLYSKDHTVLLCYPSGSETEAFTIPETVTCIGDEAFACSKNLKHVFLPESVDTIAHGAFSACSSLMEIAFPDSVRTLGSGSFWGCKSLTEVTTPKNVAVLEDVFLNCTGLKSVTIPPTVRVISSTFINCVNLERINISDFDAWCNITFGGSYCDNTDGSLHPNPLYYAHDLYLNGEKLQNIVLPDDMTQINDHAFEGGSFETVQFPAGLSKISDYAFAHCANLRELRFPAALTTLGSRVFFDCPSLTEVTVPGTVQNWTGSRFEGVGAVFESCTGLKTVTVEEGVTWLPMATFSGCSSLETVSLPESLTALGLYVEYSSFPPFNYKSGVFEGCAALKEIRLPQQLNLLGARSFAACTALTEVQIPGSVQQIGSYAFIDCTALTKAMLEQGTAETGCYMFVNSGLRDVYLPASITRIRDCLVSSMSYRHNSWYGPTMEVGELNIWYGADEAAWRQIRIDNTPEACGNDIVVDSPVQYNYHEETQRRENAVPPTCETPGSYDAVHRCLYCDLEYSRTHVDEPALGHTWGEWVVVRQATTDETGLMRRVCANDPSHVEEREIPKLELDENNEPTSAIHAFIEKITGAAKGIIDWFLRLFKWFGKK